MHCEIGPAPPAVIWYLCSCVSLYTCTIGDWVCVPRMIHSMAANCFFKSLVPSLSLFLLFFGHSVRFSSLSLLLISSRILLNLPPVIVLHYNLTKCGCAQRLGFFPGKTLGRGQAVYFVSFLLFYVSLTRYPFSLPILSGPGMLLDFSVYVVYKKERESQEWPHRYLCKG